MLYPKNCIQCATVLKKWSKLTLVMFKRQQAILILILSVSKVQTIMLVEYFCLEQYFIARMEITNLNTTNVIDVFRFMF